METKEIPYCIEEDLPIWQLLEDVTGDAPKIKVGVDNPNEMKELP